MQSTYFNTATSGTTPAVAINAANPTAPIVVRKIIIGNPTGSATLVLFNIGNALSNNTTQIAYNKTFPATLSNVPETVIDFRASSQAGGGSAEEDGLFCQTGGSLAISTGLQVTVLWDSPEGN